MILRHLKGKDRSGGAASLRLLALLAALALGIVAAGCYNNNTGAANIGGKIKLTLPAFPESGGHAVEVFTEMHFQPSYKSQEGPRLLPPEDSVPVTGREVRYVSMDEYEQLAMPDASYDAAQAQRLFTVNCAVCHGESLKGDGPILEFMTRGPFPADLTAAATQDATDGALFGFISGGGRQGLAAKLRGRESSSPMPEFRLLLTEAERWGLVRYLRSR